MARKKDYFEDLLTTWEETYKKGQLTLWLLLSLRDQARYMAEIREFISSKAKGTLSCEEQSVYRALRKFYDLEIVDYELREGQKGPDRKYYSLTKIGARLLNDFIRRNIQIYYDDDLVELMLGKGRKHDIIKKS